MKRQSKNSETELLSVKATFSFIQTHRFASLNVKLKTSKEIRTRRKHILFKAR